MPNAWMTTGIISKRGGVGFFYTVLVELFLGLTGRFTPPTGIGQLPATSSRQYFLTI
jgi:hypothetical protein